MPREHKLNLITAAAMLSLAACGEIPQDAAKPFADGEAYTGERFKGNKAGYDKALAERASFQNEYLRLEATAK